MKKLIIPIILLIIIMTGCSIDLTDGMPDLMMKEYNSSNEKKDKDSDEYTFKIDGTLINEGYKGQCRIELTIQNTTYVHGPILAPIGDVHFSWEYTSYIPISNYQIKVYGISKKNGHEELQIDMVGVVED